jgi:hypothetical protein
MPRAGDCGRPGGADKVAPPVAGAPMRVIACLFTVTILLAGCDRLPDIGPKAMAAAAESRWPGLAPQHELQAATVGMSDAKTLGKTAAALNARANALRARAARFTGPVVDPVTLARLNAAIARHSN